MLLGTMPSNGLCIWCISEREHSINRRHLHLQLACRYMAGTGQLFVEAWLYQSSFYAKTRNQTRSSLGQRASIQLQFVRPSPTTNSLRPTTPWPNLLMPRLDPCLTLIN